MPRSYQLTPDELELILDALKLLESIDREHNNTQDAERTSVLWQRLQQEGDNVA
jgi:hypothetical protein